MTRQKTLPNRNLSAEQVTVEPANPGYDEHPIDKDIVKCTANEFDLEVEEVNAILKTADKYATPHRIIEIDGDPRRVRWEFSRFGPGQPYYDHDNGEEVARHAHRKQIQRFLADNLATQLEDCHFEIE